MNVLEVNVLVLAYIGDVIYEDYIRHYLVKSGISNVDSLQSSAVNYVSAKSQAAFLKKLMDKDFFIPDEADIIRRARNYKSRRHPKGCDIITYKHATALEAVIGYLDLLGRDDRIDELMSEIIGDE